MALLTVDSLETNFHTRHGVAKILQNISYSVNEGEVLAIVGESGSGKSVTQYAILGLLPMPPAKIENGSAIFDGLDLLKCSKEQLRQIRGKKISMIFQDPMTCLNPYLKIGTQLIEPLLVHDKISKYDAMIKAKNILKEVGIVDADKRLNSYPHQFSGGMRQRIMIAMALITEPKLLIADEPTTALDVTVEAQIIDLIRREQKNRGMSVVFISHNLGVVAGFADRVIVMYAGKIAEQAVVDDIFYASKHPYTKALLSSMPSTHKPGDKLMTIPGLPPDRSLQLTGCRFAPRCQFAIERCVKEETEHRVVTPTHYTSCHRWQEGIV